MPANSMDFFSNKRIQSFFSSKSKTIDELTNIGVFSNTKTIIHLFSNGGMHSFYQFNKALSIHSSNSLKLNADHMICDSLPGGNTADAASRAMSTWIKHPLLKFIARYVILYFIEALSFVEYVKSFGKRTWSPTREATEFLATVNVKQLYLYSEIDDLIPCKDIKAHCHSLVCKGVDVEEVCWSDSEHVQHLRKHPKEYSESVYKFLGI